VYPLRVEALVHRHFEKGSKHITTGFCGTRFSGHLKTIATAGDFNIEATFDLAEVLVELAAEVGQTTVVDGFQDNVLRYKAGVQGLRKTPYALVYAAYRKITSNLCDLYRDSGERRVFDRFVGAACVHGCTYVAEQVNFERVCQT
jgi:hypothetical protein